MYRSDLVSFTLSDKSVLSMVTSMLDKAFERLPDGTELIPLLRHEWVEENLPGETD